jgi:hypothetical protein
MRCRAIVGLRPGEGGVQMVVASLLLLAGQTIVAAAATDAWGVCKRGFAKLLGRGDPAKEQLTEQKLEATREQLAGSDSDQARAAEAVAWKTRLDALLEDDPGAEAQLRALVEEVRAQLPAQAVSAADHSVAAGRDVNVTASGGGVAAGVIHGDVTPPNPTRPGSAGS